MRRTFFAILMSGVFFTLPLYAQPTIDIGQNDSEAQPLAAAQEQPAEKVSQSQAAVVENSAAVEENLADKEKKGLFSFLNFSFMNKKDPEIVKEAEEHRETFLQTLTRKAEEGNVDAQLSLGYMYLYGDADAGVTSDYEQAFKYYSMAAAQGDNIAINNLGSLYYSGVGTKRNPYKAAILFAKAADQGNVEAAVNLAFLYLSGSGIQQDSTKAMNYFAKASSQGNLTAQFVMGYAYYKGFVIGQDYKKAFELMREPAKAGFDEAQYNMALMYLNGEGITKNYGNAVKYLGNSFMQGNVQAMIKLADILAAGEVYPKNIYQAHILYNIASVRGAPQAAEKRDILEQHLKINEVLQAQTEAENFKDQPKELTNYIRKTFGANIASYIDEQMPSKQTAPKVMPEPSYAPPAAPVTINNPPVQGSRPLL